MEPAAESPESFPGLGLILDIPLKLSAELSSSTRVTEDVLGLNKGSVVEFDRISDNPVSLYANRKLIARGEVVTMDGNLGVKITALTQG